MSTQSQAVFLSYASQDAEAARRICDSLRAVGLDVWFDQSELRGGDAWDASIRRQIKDCGLFVPVISTNTNTRREGYFRLEWKLAVDRSHFMADGKAFLLPVVIDATLDANALVPDKFREVQWTHLPTNQSPAAFAERVQRLLAGEVVQPAVATPQVLRAPDAAGHEPPSIAVLPFVNMSRGEDDEYFADGLAEELLNVLSKIRGLRVAARSSAFVFKGKATTVAEVGRALKVATVLEGSVRKAGNRLRISVQLVKVADGYHLWSERYDRTLDDIFAVQDDIAQSVVKELRPTLMGEGVDAKACTEATAQVAAAVKGRATDPEAHRLYLQARHFRARGTREDAAKGMAYLKQALERDPSFALAWAYLSAAYASEANIGYTPVAAGYGRARDAAARALELEPELAEGHASLGWIRMNHDWDRKGAETSYRRALDLAPGNADVLRGAGLLACSRGRFDEAIELYQRAIEQDPLSPGTYGGLAIALTRVSRLAEAEQAYRKALELAPQLTDTHNYLALNLLDQGRHEEALTEAMREPEEWGRLFASAIIHSAAGRQGEADKALHELITTFAESGSYQIAAVYAVRGEIDLAFEWLERAHTQRDAGLTELEFDPLFRALHADPRWGAFLRKMGFAD